jgi:peptide/nickel transport system substrate-binding protein
MFTLFFNGSASAEKDTLIIGIGSEFSGIVPLNKNIVISNRDGITIFAMYDPLLWFDTKTGKLSSWIATEWSVSDDGLEYSLKIRDDVYFHNGTKMTAEDVVFTLNRMPENPTTSLQNCPGFDHAEVVDETTVKIVMSQPFAAVANFLASYHIGVLSKLYYDEVGSDGYIAHPIGTGPYKFVSRVIGGSLELEANEHYWGGAPAIKKVKLSILPDANSQIISIETGEIDVLYNPTIQNVTRLGNNKEIEWDYSDAFRTCFLRWGYQAEIADENFRKAVLSAIDYEAINKTINMGYTKKPDCLCPPGTTARPDDGTYAKSLPYDIEAAKRYLAESSYDGSTPLTMITLSGSKEESICKVIQGNLQVIGIHSEVNALDGATFVTYGSQGKYGISLYSVMPSLYDMNLLFQYFDRRVSLAFDGLPIPEKEEVADLGERALKEMNPEARKAIFAEMMDIINTHAMQGYLYQDVNTIAWRTGLAGIEAIPGTNYRIDAWSWK